MARADRYRVPNNEIRPGYNMPFDDSYLSKKNHGYYYDRYNELGSFKIFEDDNGYKRVSASDLAYMRPLFYKLPNLYNEFEKAKRWNIAYRKCNINEWITLCEKGRPVKWSTLHDVVKIYPNTNNANQFFDAKKRRAEQLVNSNSVEMPIVGQFFSKNYSLICGNARIVYLVNHGHDPTVWLIDIPTRKNRERLCRRR